MIRIIAAAAIAAAALAVTGCASTVSATTTPARTTAAAASPAAAAATAAPSPSPRCSTYACVAGVMDQESVGIVAANDSVVTKAKCKPSTVKRNPGDTWTAHCIVTYSDDSTAPGLITFEPDQGQIAFEPDSGQ